MNKPLFYRLDTGPRWSYRVVALSLLVTIGIFLVLPISEMLYHRKNKFILREISTLDIVKPPPHVPPRVKKKMAVPRPKLSEPRRKLSPLHIQAALQLDPGFGDFSLNFNLQRGLRGESLIFEISEVDEPPKPITQIAPLYPLKAKMRNIEGKVVFELIILADGSLGEIKVLSSEPGGLFVNAAMNAIRKWRFKPGTRNGKPVPTRVIKPFLFSLSR